MWDFVDQVSVAVPNYEIKRRWPHFKLPQHIQDLGAVMGSVSAQLQQRPQYSKMENRASGCYSDDSLSRIFIKFGTDLIQWIGGKRCTELEQAVVGPIIVVKQSLDDGDMFHRAIVEHHLGVQPTFPKPFPNHLNQQAGDFFLVHLNFNCRLGV